MKSGFNFKVIISHPAKKYVKKIKNRKLKRFFSKYIFEVIPSRPDLGEIKYGDLKGIRAIKFKFNNNQYRIAYYVSFSKTLFTDMMLMIIISRYITKWSKIY